MYWGKKIIEWSKTYKEAYETTLSLNNRFFLDGGDANSYTGVAWLFGRHDRPWTKRPIFGTLRYMNDKGLERKFDMNIYLKRS
jgi:deoxyribodipyrimidine photo-lyase